MGLSYVDAERIAGYTAPGSDVVPVTPSDADDLTVPGRSLVVEVSGDVHVTTLAGTERTIPAALLPDGQVFSLRVTRVWATGTTATGIWVLV